MDDLTLKILLISSGVVYLTYLYFFDCRAINDERRELIRLKSLRLTQKISLGIMIIITFMNCFNKDMSNLLILSILILSHIVLELGFKIYFGRTI
jgi:hypothetical protein